MRVARQGMDQPIRQSWEPQNGAICGDDLMSEARDMFALLRQSADAKAVDAIERLVADAPDHHLCRINALALAASEGIDEEVMVAVFLHAARIGMFDMSWNVLCPGCGGVLDTNATLKTVQKEEYVCALCADGYSPTLDEMVEVTFTVSPRVRKIAAHTPNELPFSNISGKCIGVPASTCPRRTTKRWSMISCSTMSISRLAKKRCCRCSFPPNSSSSSSR